MANLEHLAILEKGVQVWNEWRKANPDIRPDLRWLNLREVVKFSDAGHQVFVTQILNVKRGGTITIDSGNLNGIDFHETNLVGTAFQYLGLLVADLRASDLRSVYFGDVTLKEADFSQALVGETTFANIDLTSVDGLDDVKHDGASTIGIGTIFRSQGKIPEVFLRGAGVPDIFIEYAQSLVAKPIQFFSCFISHSSRDKHFCNRLYADLQANHVRVWYFPEDAKWGESVWGEIDRSIKIYDKLVVCSKHSLTSGPVLREIERALRREDEEHKNILFPITIDDYIFHGWEHPRKADVLAKVVGDFRGWSRSAAKYDAALKKLLKALKA